MRNFGKKVTKQEFKQTLRGVMIFAILEVFGSRWSAINTHIYIYIYMHGSDHSISSGHSKGVFYSKTPNAALYV